MKVFTLIAVFCFMSSCVKEEEYKPSVNQYIQDTDLMINICRKFSEERDPAALRKVILAMKSARTISCIDYNGECTVYNEFQNLAIELAQEEKFNSGSQEKLKKKLFELIDVVEAGKQKLLKASK